MDSGPPMKPVLSLADGVKYPPRALPQQIRRHSGTQRFRLGRSALGLSANHLGPIEVCDQRLQSQLAMLYDGVRSNGHLTAAAETAQNGALRADCLMRREVVEGGHSFACARIVCMDFNAQGALADRRAHLVDSQIAGYVPRKSEPVNAGSGQHERFAITTLQLAQPRVQITSHRRVNEVRPQRAQLRLSAQTAGSNTCVGRQLL